jgi:hypothetical protein
VLGPGGIGKSTICVTALHDPRMVDRYGERRYFVRCNAATSGEAILHEVATTLGLPVSPELGAQTLAVLGQAPTVLVLDNTETPWWADPEGTEATLAQIASVPGLCLIVSLRGRQRPFGLAWRDSITVPPLPTADNRKLFLAVAGQEFKDDPRLDDLIMAQDGLPLTTELLAYLAEGEPDLAGLWRQWSEQRVALLRREGGNADAGVEASFDLSINSQRMTEEARRLLSLLGILPDGIAHEDLEELLPKVGGSAAAVLRKVGLAFDEAARLRLLQPIREHVRVKYAPQPNDLDRTVAYYSRFAYRLGWQVRRPGGAKARSRLLTERGNLEVVLRYGFQQQDPRPSIRAAVALRDFIRFSGIGAPQLLEAAADAAGRVGDLGLQGQSLFTLGAIALSRSDLATAQARFDQAQPLYKQVKNVRGQANCILGLGEVAMERSDLATAQARFEEALHLYEQTEERKSMGRMHLRLARLAATAVDRNSHIRAAREAWEGINRPDLLEELDDEFDNKTAAQDGR